MELDKDLARELIDLARNYEDESEQQYLAVVRRVSQTRAMVKGESCPGDWWDESRWEWQRAEQSLDYEKESAPRFNYHINFMQAWWQILQGAIQTVGIPGSTFRPQNPQDQKDREAAQTAKEIIDYQRTVIDFRDLLLGIYRLFFTDGICLGYTRHVTDAIRFGTRMVSRPITAPQVVREAGYKCFECDGFTPAGQTMRDEAGNIMCPGCEGPLHAENFLPEETAEVMVGEEQQEVPNGREITDLYGALESFLPWWANDLDHAHYCKIVTDITKEEVIAAFAGDKDKKRAERIEKEITERGGRDSRMGAQARRYARTPMNSGLGGYGYSDTEHNLIAYSRWWFRPQCFYRVQNPERRAALLKKFPTGVFFQLAGVGDPVFLDAYEEKLESKLELMRPLKGDGMYTPSLGQNGVPIQLSVDDAWNMALEGMLFAGFPQGLIDADVFSGQGIKDSRVQPGTWKEIKLPGGKTLRESFAEMKSADISQSVQNFIQMAAPMGELLLGTERVLQGGPITNVRTSSGQAQARSQALQRQAPAYGAAKTGLAGIQERMVNEFLQNRPAETYFQVVSNSGDYEERKIQLNPQRGRVVAYPEVSESIPQTWAQKTDALMNIGEQAGQNPVFQAWLIHPKNARVYFDAVGVPELTVPGKELADKYERLIPILLEGQPQPQEMPNEADPEAEPVVIAAPSIQFDPVADDPNVFIAVFQMWAATPEGMAIAAENGPGYQNLRAYAEQAWTARNMAMQAQAAAQNPQRQAA